jgi:hypothetical protein
VNREKIVRLIVWFSFLISIGFYAIIVAMVKVEQKEIAFNPTWVLIWGAIFAILPHLLKYFKSLRRIPYLVGYAIAEIPALMGLLLYFIYTQKDTAFRLIALSCLSIIFLFPLGNLVKNKSDDYNPIQ